MCISFVRFHSRAQVIRHPSRRRAVPYSERQGRAAQDHRLAPQMSASEARRRTDSNALARNPHEYSSRAPLSKHTMLTHAAYTRAQWFPLILDALVADKFVDFVHAFCECSVPLIK